MGKRTTEVLTIITGIVFEPPSGMDEGKSLAQLTAEESYRREHHIERPSEEGARASINKTIMQIGWPMRLTRPTDNTRIKA